MTVRDLLSALLVGSANDAAVALAEAASGSVEAFVQEMNVKAASLGLANTHFANPHGLDAPGHYSSARDLATLARYALANPEFRRLVDTWECTVADVSGLSSRSLTNHNALLGQLDWVTGVKTGFTGDAGFCLVASGEKDGVSVISVVLGEAVKEECWKDSRSLLEYGLSRQRRLAVVDEGTVVAEAEVPYESAGTLRLVTKQAVELCLSPEDEIVITACVDGELRPPIEAGQPCGRLTVSVEGGEPRTVALVAEQDCPTPTLGTKLVYLWGRLSR
jgi:D-alanyl-D-alanine carboxypeptidase (penicillin-binding protein 5/6)